MFLTGFVGSILQAYGAPFFISVAFFWGHPNLVVIALAGAFFGFLSVILNSLVHVIILAATNSPTGGVTNAEVLRVTEEYAALVILTGLVFHIALRLFFARLLVIGEEIFRGNQQLMHKSRFRLMPLGAAWGFGFGVTQSLLSFGTLAETHSKALGLTMSQGATWYDLETCPQLPFFYFQAWVQMMYLGVHTMVMTVMVPAVASFRQEDAFKQLSDGAVAVQSSTSDVAVPQEMSTRRSDGPILVRPASPPTLRGSDAGATPRGPPPYDAAAHGPIVPRLPSLTTLQRTDALVAIVAANTLHAIFSLVSLANRGAFDYETILSSFSRGCVVSLPVQASVTVVLIAMVLGLCRVELVRE